MKILHILAGGTIGGIEKLCLDFARICPEHGFFFIKNVGVLIAEYQNVNTNIYVFGNSCNLSLRNVYEIADQINELVNKVNYEAVVVHHGGAFMWFTARRLRKINKAIPVFIYFHSVYDDVIYRKNFIRRFLNKISLYLLLNNINGIIAISQAVADSVEKRHVKLKNRIFVNYNGVDIQKYKNSVLHDYSKIRMVYVGRLIEEKGVQNIINSLFNCSEIDFSLDIIGDGCYRPVLEELVDKSNLSTKITFLGKRDNVAQLLPNYNFFIHLPKWEEGFGLTIIEGLASSLICIVNNRGAIPEIITDKVDGFIFDASEQYDLKQLFLDILNNKYDLQKMSDNTQEKVRKFDVKNTILRLEEICSKI